MLWLHRNSIMSPKSKKIDDGVTSILTTVLKLCKLKVPVVVAFHYRGRSQQFGTRHAREQLQQHAAEMTFALERDALCLCSTNNDEPLVSTNMDMTDKERALGYFSDLFKNDDIPKLPAKIELLKAKEAIKILRNLIVYDHNQSSIGESEERFAKKKEQIYIKYGAKSWEPSFWPNHLWKWEDVQNFSNVTVSELKDVGLDGVYESVTDFYKDVIRMGLEHYSLDPDEHIDENYNEEEEASRKKARHIKDAPRIRNNPPHQQRSLNHPLRQSPPNLPRRVMSPPDHVQGDGGPAMEYWQQMLQDDHHHEYEYRFPSPNAVSPRNDNSDHDAEYQFPSTDMEAVGNDVAEVSESVASNISNPHPSTSLMPEPTATEPILDSLFPLDSNVVEVSPPICALPMVWPNCTIRRNKGGSSSLSRATAQAMGLLEDDFWRIKMEIHETIVKDFIFFCEPYKFPIKLNTENGVIDIDGQYSLFNYLRSPDSMKLYNIPLVEMKAIGIMIGASVHVLHQRKDESIYDFDKRWEWDTIDVVAPHLINKKRRFYTGKDIYLITEDDINFYLLSTSCPEYVVQPEPSMITPQAEVVAEPNESVTPTEETVTAIEEMVTPTEETVRPTNEIVTPTENTATPIEDPVTSTENTLTPREEIVHGTVDENDETENNIIREAGMALQIEQFNMVPVSRLSKVMDTDSNETLSEDETISTDGSVRIETASEDEENQAYNRYTEPIRIVTRGVSTRSSSSEESSLPKRGLSVMMPSELEVIVDISNKRRRKR